MVCSFYIIYKYFYILEVLKFYLLHLSAYYFNIDFRLCQSFIFSLMYYQLPQYHSLNSQSFTCQFTMPVGSYFRFLPILGSLFQLFFSCYVCDHLNFCSFFISEAIVPGFSIFLLMMACFLISFCVFFLIVSS